MAVTLEQVEQLRQKADISYEEAKLLLEQTDGNLLDALILLERQGRMADGGGFFTTQSDGSSADPTGPLRSNVSCPTAHRINWRCGARRCGSPAFPF